MSEKPRPIGTDPDGHTGTRNALRQTFRDALPDNAADAAFAAMIDRLRGVPGTHKGGTA